MRHYFLFVVFSAFRVIDRQNMLPSIWLKSCWKNIPSGSEDKLTNMEYLYVGEDSNNLKFGNGSGYVHNINILAVKKKVIQKYMQSE